MKRASDFRFSLCTRLLGSRMIPTSTLSSWPPTRPPTEAHLTTCKSSKPFSFLLCLFFWLFTRYRMLSIHVEEKSKTTPDKADAIRQIDVYTIPVDLVYQRFSTSPTIGLESPAVARLTDPFGKNFISPPKTQYWKNFRRRFSTTYSEASIFLCGSRSLSQSWVSPDFLSIKNN